MKNDTYPVVIYDARMPHAAIEALSDYAVAVPLSTQGITDDILSGHPDVFACDALGIVAPNMPPSVRERLTREGVAYVSGSLQVGAGKYNNAHYNAVVSEHYLLHHIACTDDSILAMCSKPGLPRQCINVRQSFVRCTTIALRQDSFITSDEGVYKQLCSCKVQALYVDGKRILLPGARYGFIGGCMGIYGDELFLTGSLKYLEQGDMLAGYIRNMGYHIVELYDGPLFDGGSLSFWTGGNKLK